MPHWFHKTLPINIFYLFSKFCVLEKKARNIYTRMFGFTFPGEDGGIIKGGGMIKAGGRNIYKNNHLSGEGC